ncbi:MAG TPA: outer membrane beta-barrel protein [Pyrinomonadaceae bacterium]|nr:outer membrane beta-barrel protein [Pyrinomonadaceae bacterium]
MNSKTGCAAALILLCLFSAPGEARAQAREDVPKVEVGVQFSSLTLSDNFNTTQPGFGGRVTYNLTESVAVEAETNFFPNELSFRTDHSGGRASQAHFGVKAGRRFDKFGLFAKARPGLVHFTKTQRVSGFSTDTFNGETFIFPNFRTQSVTHFATDIGGVIEFYPSRRLVTRFDAGDTIIRHGGYDAPRFFSGELEHRPSAVTHNFQFTAGIGFRF